MSVPGNASLPLKLRWLGIGLGAAVLVWLPFEDSGGLVAILLAAGLCGWVAVILLGDVGTSPRRLVLRSAAIGMLAGLLVSPLAFFLMSLKSGVHAHPQPDYPPVEIQAIFSRTIYFAASGLLLGLASALFRLARSEPEEVG